VLDEAESSMAVFDVAQQRMCVRVVYDGVASAGKTTNLRQLAELFATQRTGELFSPAELDGHTLYFDWLQIAAGMVCGFPLLCQAISVPGQLVLTTRRRHLLASADVVVHVCDSEPQAVLRAREGLLLFDEVQRDRGRAVPLVIQANKQDQRGALSGADVLAALQRPGMPVVEAIASDGIGVVDTFVAAVRAVVRAIQAGMENGDVRVAVRPAERAGAVLDRLSAEEVDPDWAVEMMLEEASNAFQAVELVSEASPSESDGQGDGKPIDARAARKPLARLIPALPTEHVPTGFIWPAHTGRAALRALAGDPQMKRPVALGPEGHVRLVVGDFVLSTGQESRFESAEAARQALVRAARERTQLGALLAPETVLVAQPAGDETSWLWTILPRMPTVAQLAASDETTVLTAYGVALVDAVKVEATCSVILDLLPGSFGLRHGAVRYLGHVAARGSSGRDARGALRTALDALAKVARELEPAIVAIEEAIGTKLDPEELARLSRSVHDSERPGSTDGLRAAFARIDEAFERAGRAA
jgi:signal recognition particle receptor subunit beta